MFAYFHNLFSKQLLLTGSDSTLKSTGRVKIYHVNYPVTGSIIAVGMVSDFFAIGRLKSKPKITAEELAFINSGQQRNLINSIDRWALNLDVSDRDLYTRVSDYREIGIFVLPALHKLSYSKCLSAGLSTSPGELGLSVVWKLDNKRIR